MGRKTHAETQTETKTETKRAIYTHVAGETSPVRRCRRCSAACQGEYCDSCAQEA